METPPPKSEVTVINLKPIEATPESFKEFGQVIGASPDGELFGPNDAQLDLSKGIPRFYIMNLQSQLLRFSMITHHASVTQCLGSIGGHVWYLGVAKPSLVDSKEVEKEKGKIAVQSRFGHFYLLQPLMMFMFSEFPVLSLLNFIAEHGMPGLCLKQMQWTSTT
ncbi:hypothetical protein F3Y22_tig00113726pilonHSYRG00369 [Hibiscus syriacus]|uniref:Uncharacterized protein n=1 Tax=Hibiscus syriacus TaxID=106335 RepID=A0A6A2XGV8_HIBSY|nr:hypothetical protein F3Y22_tig00113726pilonHSYRG00369 [Hibiscus syriacus]